MEYFITNFQSLIVQFLDIILILFIVPLVTLGITYIFGRMLNLLQRNRSRNIIAVLLIYGIHTIYTYLPTISSSINPENVVIYSTIISRIWAVFIRGSISITIYVLLFWRIFDRINSLLDKKIGEDKEKNYIDKPKRIRKK